MKSRFYILAVMMIFALLLSGCKKKEKETPVAEPKQEITAAAKPVATPMPAPKAELKAEPNAVPTSNMAEILEKIKTMQADVNIPAGVNDIKK